jgi:hypothetical protein
MASQILSTAGECELWYTQRWANGHGKCVMMSRFNGINERPYLASSFTVATATSNEEVT